MCHCRNEHANERYLPIGRDTYGTFISSIQNYGGCERGTTIIQLYRTIYFRVLIVLHFRAEAVGEGKGPQADESPYLRQRRISEDKTERHTRRQEKVAPPRGKKKKSNGWFRFVIAHGKTTGVASSISRL